MSFAAHQLEKDAKPFASPLSPEIARTKGAQAGCRAAQPAWLGSMTPANLSSTRKRLSTLAQVFGLIPCAAGRTLRNNALMLAASAGAFEGCTPAMSQTRSVADRPIQGRRLEGEPFSASWRTSSRVSAVLVSLAIGFSPSWLAVGVKGCRVVPFGITLIPYL